MAGDYTVMGGVEAVMTAKLSEARARIEARLSEISGSFMGLGLTDMVNYISRGGKRLRGFLSIVTCEGLGGAPDDAVDIAVAAELVHSASLALDDIVDQDIIRRGGPSAWVLYGVGKTAMVSLFLVPIALKLVEKHGQLALSYSISAWEEMVRGEIMDAYSAISGQEADYLEIIRLKTGSLFALASALGAIAAKRPDIAEAAYRYGELIGVSYQVADDLVDYLAYLDGFKKRLDPSEKSFERWARESLSPLDGELTSKVLNYLRGRIEEASKEAYKLFSKGPLRDVMPEIPRFFVSSMLAQKGLSL
ncbi:MAG: polyprenyl synthetase family protein [Acidilobus sp.]